MSDTEQLEIGNEIIEELKEVSVSHPALVEAFIGVLNRMNGQEIRLQASYIVNKKLQDLAEGHEWKINTLREAVERLIDKISSIEEPEATLFGQGPLMCSKIDIQ